MSQINISNTINRGLEGEELYPVNVHLTGKNNNHPVHPNNNGTSGGINNNNNNFNGNTPQFQCLASSANFSECIESLPEALPCVEISNIFQDPVLANLSCEVAQDFLSYLNSPYAIGDTQDILNWYQNTFAPCFSTICSTTSYPVDQNALVQVPTNLIKQVYQSQLPKSSLFFMKYGIFVTAILTVVIIILIVSLLFKVKK